MIAAVKRRLTSGLTIHPIVAALIIAFGAGGLVIAATGGAPLVAFGEMLLGGFTGSGLRNTLIRSIPIVGMALAFSLAFRAGILNLGGEGQMLLGALAGTMTAILLPGSGPIVVLVAVVTGALVGAAWAFLPAIGQTHLQVPLLVTTLLLNYVARAITSYLVRFPFGEPGAAFATTGPVPETARIPKFELFGSGRISIALLVVLALSVLLSLVYRRSVFGYETEMLGLSGPFARYGGVDTSRKTLVVMVAAGAIGGAVGTYLVIGETYRYIDADMLAQTGFAWTGLMVALLAFNRPVPILVVGIFFAGLQIGGFAMERATGVSWQLAQVIQAIVIVAVVSRFALGLRPGEEIEPTPVEAETSHLGEV